MNTIWINSKQVVKETQKEKKCKWEKRNISLKAFTSKEKVENDEDNISEDSLKDRGMGLFISATTNI